MRKVVLGVLILTSLGFSDVLFFNEDGCARIGKGKICKEHVRKKVNEILKSLHLGQEKEKKMKKGEVTVDDGR